MPHFPVNFVKIPQLDVTVAPQTLKIYYPHGETLVVSGVFRGCFGIGTGELFAVVSVPLSGETGSLTGLFGEIRGFDPLCVVVNVAGGEVLYDPRELYERFPSRLQCELDARPHWPNVLEIVEDKRGARRVL